MIEIPVDNLDTELRKSVYPLSLVGDETQKKEALFLMRILKMGFLQYTSPSRIVIKNRYGNL